jgi:hypothetical protein
MSEKKCGHCGSDKMKEDVQLNSQSCLPANRIDGPAAFVHSDPNALLLRGTVFGKLRARVCGGCGYTEIYTKNFEKLYEAYQQSQGG